MLEAAGPTSAVYLITGGTGSFGTTVTRKLLASDDIAEIRILSRDEAKQDDMRRWLSDSRLRFYVGDVRDYRSFDEAVRGVDHVFHAAALKQVPSCEFFPQQAVTTNVHGTDNVLRASFVRPPKTALSSRLPLDRQGGLPHQREGDEQGTNGESRPSIRPQQPRIKDRRLMCQVRQRHVFEGSAIPLFVELLREGKPLTITDPNMTRFLMSLDES